MRVLSYDPSGDYFFVETTWNEFRKLAGKYKMDTHGMGVEEVIENYKLIQEDQEDQNVSGWSYRQYIMDLYDIDYMPDVCLITSRDLSDIEVELYDFPFGHMWNGESPWEKIETVVIHDLTDLAVLECVGKERQKSDISVYHGFEERGAKPEYSTNFSKEPMTEPERHTVGSLLKQAVENMAKQRGPYNMLWSRKDLTPQKVGVFCEYYAKMTLISYGINIYTSEIDDHGIDFVAEGRDGLLKFQVKGIRGSSQYVFMMKEYFNIEDDAMFLLLMLLIDGEHPDMYIIPTSAWRQKSSVFVSHDYEGKKSKPDYGVNVSRKNMPELEKYHIKNMLSIF